jgi:hypothetical protein
MGAPPITSETDAKCDKSIDNIVFDGLPSLEFVKPATDRKAATDARGAKNSR